MVALAEPPATREALYDHICGLFVDEALVRSELPLTVKGQIRGIVAWFTMAAIRGDEADIRLSLESLAETLQGAAERLAAQPTGSRGLEWIARRMRSMNAMMRRVEAAGR
jgi:hypothetical protein